MIETDKDGFRERSDTKYYFEMRLNCITRPTC